MQSPSTESRRISGTNGLKLAALLDYPRTGNPDGAAIVLHGFSGYKTEVHIEKLALDLAAVGFLTLRFDASGFGESEGNPERDFRVSNYLSDIFHVSDYLTEEFKIDRIVLTGHSLGANLAIIAAGQSDRFVACSAIQPPTKLPRDTWRRDKGLWKQQGYLELESGCPGYSRFRLPWEFVEDADRFDARDFVGQVTCPLQILYGTEDDAVAPADTISIYERAPQQIELVELKGVGHFYVNHPEQMEQVSSYVVPFLSRIFD